MSWEPFLLIPNFIGQAYMASRLVAHDEEPLYVMLKAILWPFFMKETALHFPPEERDLPEEIEEAYDAGAHERRYP